jgi:serine protease AprX
MAKKSPPRRAGRTAAKRRKRPVGASSAPAPSGTAPGGVSVTRNSAAVGTASSRDKRIELSRGAALPSMLDPERRESWGFSRDDTKPDPYMIELNLRYPGGLLAAAKAFRELLDTVVDDPDRITAKITSAYYRCELNVAQWSKLIELDEQWELKKRPSAARGKKPWVRCIYRVWPDFIVQPLMDCSIATVKADAALKSFSASGRDITWAIIDSGVQADHPHFGPTDDEDHHRLNNSEVSDLHRDFTIDPNGGVSENIDEPLPPPLSTTKTALVDEFGHGTHVAGIVSGQAPLKDSGEVIAFERVFVATSDTDHQVTLKERTADATELRGVAPECNLVSLKVLNAQGAGRTSNVIRALAYIRNYVNRNPKLMRIHGVNLSLGYEFDAEMFACGQSPLCAEVDRLVQSGVVVVAAAGNTGWGIATSAARSTRIGFTASINDPGNSERAITVGATHRESPHTYGVSFFSSKGPTGDGRLKPDLVAPGERITSCAAGRKQAMLPITKKKRGKRQAAYLDDSGTSMAAPHVSGSIAAFLSIRREFIGRPDDVKKIFLNSATPLGRERYFEGHGLVDLMRAIQSV